MNGKSICASPDEIRGQAGHRADWKRSDVLTQSRSLSTNAFSLQPTSPNRLSFPHPYLSHPFYPLNAAHLAIFADLTFDLSQRVLSETCASHPSVAWYSTAQDSVYQTGLAQYPLSFSSDSQPCSSLLFLSNSEPPRYHNPTSQPRQRVLQLTPTARATMFYSHESTSTLHISF